MSSRPLRFDEALRWGAKPEVLVRFPRQLGDVVFVIPFLNSLRESWNAQAEAAGVQIRWVALGHAMGAGLFSEAAPEFFAETRLDGAHGKLEPLPLARRWREEGPPAGIVTLGQSARLSLAAWLGGVPIRAGISDNGLGWMYHAHTKYRGEQAHLGARLSGLAAQLGLPPLRFEKVGSVQLGGTGGVAKLKAAGWDGHERLVALAPGTRAEGKRWAPEEAHWPGLARSLSDKGFRPVLLGTAEEAGLATLIREAAPRTLDLVGQTSLAEAAAILETAGAAVAVDTGLAHLAALVDCAIVTLFGPSHEWFAQPIGNWSLALRGNPFPSGDGAPAPPEALDASLPHLHVERVVRALEMLASEREAALLAERKVSS
ncbi:MAG TPA: glycosyltransferase family 9 protein [Holophagaceae bacterium]|jgi:heptosyltransferase-2|nr:glycosyltransferase family 9 protein [Holophagaceae bacterium]